MTLSVCSVSFNEEWIIAKTFNAVKDIADEMILVDSGSTDKTREIAASLGVKVYVETPYKGCGLQKNAAIEKCTSDWILFVDADEVVSEKLKEEIVRIINLPDAADIYKVRFISYCFGRLIKHGGWSSFYKVRFFKNGAGKFSPHIIHSYFVPEENSVIDKINADILHFTYKDITHYITKNNRYTNEKALMQYKKGKKPQVLKLIFSPIIRFIKSYFIKLGFLDGVDGLIMSILGSWYAILQFLKLHELWANHRS
ncbi:MAG: glycosyltransferase family 2 protein [Bacteroidota bacterium]|nr:glycosyltransferase family 2 protein [Bacteroidota bacterium]